MLDKVLKAATNSTRRVSLRIIYTP